MLLTHIQEIAMSVERQIDNQWPAGLPERGRHLIGVIR